MKLTEAKLKELILEAYRQQQFEVSTPTWKSFPAVPEGFRLRKDGKDEIELMSQDFKKMMEIAIDLNTGEVQVNIFVREPESKTFHWIGGKSASSKEVFESTYDELTRDLLSTSPDDI